MVKIDETRMIEWPAGSVVSVLSEVLAVDEMAVIIGDTELSHPVRCEIGEVSSDVSGVLWTVGVKMWAEPHPGRFPRCDLEFQLRGIDSTTTELALVGEYHPPTFGWLVDRVALHRLAESSIRRYLDLVVERLGHRLGEVEAMIGVPV